LVVAEEGVDAGGESLHAPCARNFASDGCRGFEARDCAADGRGALNAARDGKALCRRRPDLAVGGGADGRGTGSPAIPEQWHQTGAPAVRRAGLGLDTPGTHRQACELSILWGEYIAQEPEGCRHSRFCELYRGWDGKLSVTMRQSRAGSEILFVDYANEPVPVVVDRLTGETRPAWIFVAMLGASSFTYAEASWTQGLGNWIDGHTGAFAAFGGVSRLILPDNPKRAVIKACLYEPTVNRSYTEMAAHYDTAVLPARPR